MPNFKRIDLGLNYSDLAVTSWLLRDALWIPLVICFIAIENGLFIVDLPLVSVEIFQFAMLVYQWTRE